MAGDVEKLSCYSDELAYRTLEGEIADTAALANALGPLNRG